jgi:hypothetical protein
MSFGTKVLNDTLYQLRMGNEGDSAAGGIRIGRNAEILGENIP